MHSGLCQASKDERGWSCLGAVLFGVGWGLAGYCPGPALASVGFGGAGTLLFVAAMLDGMTAFHLLDRRVLTSAGPG
jgi:uncharacterized membrane protein YedE/YeeE